MRKALRCCRFPRIIVKRCEHSAEWVSSCLNPLMMLLRDISMACCKLYDIFIPATAFICERLCGDVFKKTAFQTTVDRAAAVGMWRITIMLQNLFSLNCEKRKNKKCLAVTSLAFKVHNVALDRKFKLRILIFTILTT